MIQHNKLLISNMNKVLTCMEEVDDLLTVRENLFTTSNI